MDEQEARTVEDIAADVIAELDAPEGDEAASAEPQAAEAPRAQEPDGQQPEQSGDEEARAEADGAPAGAEDFLAASGVRLEDILEGIEDEQQRAFLESRYKDMQRYFFRRTEELAHQRKQAEQTVSEAEELRARVAALEQMLAQAQRGQQEPDGEDAIQRYLYAGIERPLTPEEAIESPEKMAEFIRQQAIIEARRQQLPLIKATYERLSTVEQAVMERAYEVSRRQVEELFADFPQYRTPEVEQRIAELIERTGVSLEDAFYAVLGPRLKEDALKLGFRMGEVKARKTSEEAAKARAQYAVPSGASAGAQQEAPIGRSLDEILDYAMRSLE